MTVADRIDFLNAITRLLVTLLLMAGSLYGLVNKDIEGSTFLQMASMAVAFWLGQRPVSPSNNSPSTTTTTVTPTKTTTTTEGKPKR